MQKKLQIDSKYNDKDLNGDGVVSDDELDEWKQSEEVKRLNRKQMHQRNMAWTALVSMILFKVEVTTFFTSFAFDPSLKESVLTADLL